MEHLQHQVNNYLEFFKAFSEMGRQSLGLISGLKMYESSQEDLAREYLDEPHIEFNNTLDEYLMEVREVKPGGEPRTVVAVDTSSARIAESARGVVVSLKGAVVVRDQEKRLTVETAGPFLFYVTRKNSKNILGDYYELLKTSTRYEFYQCVQRILTEMLERRLQIYAAERYRGAILLLDGSLVTSNFFGLVRSMEDLIRAATKNVNDVLAFTKSSFLQLAGQPLHTFHSDLTPPYLIDMTRALEFSGHGRLKFYGRVYLARLARGSPGYRVDAHLQDDVSIVFGRLLRSDPLIYGYPEALILAHTYATFTRLDMVTIQAMLREMDVELVYPESIRRMLFSPIDGG